MLAMRKPREMKVRFTASGKKIEEAEYFHYICASIEAEMKKQNTKG